MNLFVDNPTASKLTSMHFYGWTERIKNGHDYLRTQGSDTQAVQYTIE
jgi:ribonucleoside-diphosphate reductase alpha chain